MPDTDLLAELASFVDELEADPGLGGAYDANMTAADRIRSIINKAQANDWTQQDDGTWTLPVGHGYLLVVDADSTPEDRVRRADGYWAKRPKTRPSHPAPCADCITGGHGPNHHRKHLPPPPIVPAEHCGELLPSVISNDQTECVLRPGHQGSHADDRGCRWWPTPEAVDWQQRAENAEQRRDVLAATLDEVLRHFVHKGHPGEPCLQTGWISEKTVARWRAIAYPTKDGNQ